jgi:hypothetical protein
MARIINKDANPGSRVGQLLGESLTQGLGSALGGFLDQKRQQVNAHSLGALAGFDANQTKALGMLPVDMQKFVVQNKVAQRKEREKSLGAVTNTLKAYNEQFEKEEISQIKDLTDKLINQGYGANQAAELAYRQFSQTMQQQQNQQQQEGQQEAQGGFLDRQTLPGLIGEKLGLTRAPNLEDVKGATAKMARPAVGALDFVQRLGKDLVEKSQNLARGLAGKQPVEPSKQKSLLGMYDELTGNRGIAETPAQRIIQGSVFGLPGIAQNAIEEVVEGLPLPENIKENAKIVLGTIAFLKTGQSKADQKLANILLDKAEKISKATGKPVAQVLGEAQTKANVDLQKVAEGDVKEFNKLKNSITEAPEVAKRVTETPKEVFNPKEAIKQRQLFTEKVKESPLEKYYEPEASRAKRPETIAKEKAITERTTKEIKEVNDELSLARRNLRDAQAERRSASPEQREKIESGIKYYEEHRIPELQKQIDDLRYEQRHFTKRMSDSELISEVKKSGERIEKEIRSPTEKGQERIARQLELDKQYLERAQKLTERGSLPGEFKPDEHIRIQKAYIEGYQQIIKQQKELLKELRSHGTPEAALESQKVNKFIQSLESRLPRLKANVTNQADKISALRTLNKPSGAFIKNQIKDAFKNLKEFQKDLFQHGRVVKSAEDLKASSVVQKALKNPTPENIKAAAKEAGVEKEFNEAIKETEAELNKENTTEEKLGDILERQRKKIKEKANQKAKETKKGEEKPSKLGQKILNRFTAASLLTPVILFFATGGRYKSIAQALTGWQKNSQINDYRDALKIKDPVARHKATQKIILEWKSEGFSAAKINSLRQAAQAKNKLEAK